MFRNDMPRYEILSEQAMVVIEGGWRRLLSDIGIEFLHDESLERFRAAGQTVEGSVVRFDPDWVLEQVAKAPQEFDLVARNPARTVRVGGRHMFFAPTQGPPFVREGDDRREATMDDFERLCRLSQSFDQLDTPGGLCCEPGDRPLDSRHLDMLLAVQTLTDKPYMGAVISQDAARDSVAMTDILHGGPADGAVRMFGVVNANSPLRYDTRMIEAMTIYAEAGQAVVITPFLLMGAMSPASVPAALVQQTAESLAGLALAQLVRPGAPVVLGSFLSHTDMQSGSPGFGGPESAMGLLCSGQIARRFGVPWRAGGGFLTSSQTPDAQAAYEGLNTMLPAFLAGANYVEHAAGWLESGLVASLREVHRRHRDAAHVAGGVHAARGGRGQPGLRCAPGGRPRRSLPRRGAHAGAVPDVLLPTASVLDGELRAVEVQGLARRRRARGRDLAQDALRVRAAAARRRGARRARRLRRAPPRRARRLEAGRCGSPACAHTASCSRSPTAPTRRQAALPTASTRSSWPWTPTRA